MGAIASIAQIRADEVFIFLFHVLVCDRILTIQVLIVGDSITRGLSGQGFDVRTFPGITAEKLCNEVIIYSISVLIKLFPICPLITVSTGSCTRGRWVTACRIILIVNSRGFQYGMSANYGYHR